MPAPTVTLPVDQMRRLACDRRFLNGVAQIYADLDARIAARRPACINRGACCKFGAFGHRLYVTPAELTYFLATSGRRPQDSETACCPYQQGGVCTVRDARPAGCRVFFCEAASQAWQGPETEATLRQIKRLHAEHHLPYAYVEWLAALRQLKRDWPAEDP